MPPKTQITKNMIIETGLNIIRDYGVESLNVRRIASAIKCSTQPIMYQFQTVEKLKDEIYFEADKYHTSYIMNADFINESPMLAIGLRYIKFAAEEKHLFRFLFQTDKYANKSLDELIDNEDIAPIFLVLQEQAEITEKQSKDAFAALFLTVHGIASLLANNSMEYHEEYFKNILNNVFMGVMGNMKGGNV